MQDYTEGLVQSRMPEHTFRPQRFYHMIQALRFSAGLEGATAEAGCFRGLSSYLICCQRRREEPSFDGAGHFMVDSFQGLSTPTEQDGAFGAKRYAEGAFTTTSLEHCRKSLQDFPRAEIIQGWIPQAFGTLPEQRYRFVHIDVDIYQPTKDALAYFYPRLSPGGMIVVDDHGPWPEGQWPGCRVAVAEFVQESNARFMLFSSGNALIQRPG